MPSRPNIQVKGLSLRLNFLWTLAGSAIYNGCQWGMLVVLAKLSSAETVGQFAFGWAVCTPIFMGSSLQLRIVQATDARLEYQFGHYFALRLVTVIFAYLLIASITFLIDFRRETRLIILAIGLAKGIESIGDIFFGLFQQLERMDRIAISGILKGLSSLIMLVLVLSLTGEVLWGIIAMAATWGLVLVFYDLGRVRKTLAESAMDQTSSTLRAYSSMKPLWERNILSRLALKAFPLGVVALLWSLDANIPRYFIGGYWGERELGIFAALAALLTAMKLLVTTLSQTANPRLAKYYANGQNRLFLSLLGKLVTLGIFLGLSSFLVAKFVGRELLTWLYTPEYAQYENVLIWFTVAFTIGTITTFLDNTLIIIRRFKTQMFIFSFQLALTFLFCYWLIPAFGILGATLAIVWSSSLQLIIVLLLIGKILRSFYLQT